MIPADSAGGVDRVTRNKGLRLMGGSAKVLGKGPLVGPEVGRVGESTGVQSWVHGEYISGWVHAGMQGSIQESGRRGSNETTHELVWWIQGGAKRGSGAGSGYPRAKLVPIRRYSQWQMLCQGHIQRLIQGETRRGRRGGGADFRSNGCLLKEDGDQRHATGDQPPSPKHDACFKMFLSSCTLLHLGTYFGNAQLPNPLPLLPRTPDLPLATLKTTSCFCTSFVALPVPEK